jgi:hypothetical protein
LGCGSFIKAGADAGRVIGNFESTASGKGCKVRQIFLNIGDPGAGDIFRGLLSKGYFFGGYLPRWFDTDGFLLQKLTGTPALESINLYSDRAKELLEFTLKDRERGLRVKDSGIHYSSFLFEPQHEDIAAIPVFVA